MRSRTIGMLALVLGFVCAGPAQAQLKIAVVNVGEVFQKYEKAKFYKDELEKVLGPKKVEAETLKKQMLDWKKAVESGAVKKEDVERYQQAVLANKRKLEDLDLAVRNHVGKIQESQIVTIYKDVSGAVERVAKSNGISLVLAYGDVTDDQFNIFNINRKMSGMDLGSTVPLFCLPEANLTAQVVEALNSTYRGAGGAISASPVSLPK